MKFKISDIDKKWKEYALAGCICILFYLILTHLGKIFSVIGSILDILQPVIIGFVIAYILNPLAVFFKNKVFKFIKNKNARWAISVLVTLLIVILVFVALFAMLIPQIGDNIASLINNYPSYVSQFQTFLADFEAKYGSNEFIEGILNNIKSGQSILTKVGDFIKNNYTSILSMTSEIGSSAVNIGIGFIFAVYFLMAKKSIKVGLSKAFSLMLSPLKFEKLRILLEKFHNIFSKYIVFELLDGLIVGASNYIFMIILRMPDALFISLIVGVTNLIPTFGPIIGAAFGSFILLLLQPKAILPFLIFSVVIQTIDGYILKPKLFGGALNVPGFLILVAIIVFGKIMGVVGMLIAIPIAAIIVYIYKEIFIEWLELRRELKQYRKDNSKSES